MIGTKLNGRYEIQSLLGEGSTATVYTGRDTLLGREVAIKVLLPHVRDTTRERFFQEAMSAAQLNHPNIMAIYDRGVDDSRHYLIIEYIAGDPLSAFIPSSANTVVALGVQIARALHYAHERDIIHRDVKPANIKVRADGTVKIMDLGLALPREAKRVTAPGMVIGTPAYISPEQAQGMKLDRRTDIYSLGIVLYEMATGQLPFNADEIMALLLQHVQQPVPPPRLIATDMPMALENVIQKALEKKPERRYQTAAALADALEASLPTAPRTITQQAPRVEEPQDRHNQTERILVADPRKRIIRVVMADDHALLRRALGSFLEAHDEFVVMAEAGDGETALTQTVEIQPDVLILDLNMPGRNGLDIIPDVRQKAPDVKVLVLTGRDDDIYIMRALRAGAHGYILKSTDESRLIDGIRKVLEDEIVLGRGVAEKVVTGMIYSDVLDRINEQQKDILLHIAAGYSDDAIARKLGVDITVLIELMARVLSILRVRDRNAAALKALRDGIISLEALHELPPPDART